MIFFILLNCCISILIIRYPERYPVQLRDSTTVQECIGGSGINKNFLRFIYTKKGIR